ncbi:MAG: ABC transporter ATP-binding protein [Planctomycetota bacterium]
MERLCLGILADGDDAQESDNAMEAILKAYGLYKFYRIGGEDVAVLRDVSFTVGKGRFVAIMGPSGSGKSTLLHIVSGLDRPTSGSVELAGRSLFDLSERERTLLRRKLVGFVFQFYNLVPHLTVAENIGLPLMLAGVDDARRSKRFSEVVGFFELERKLGQRPHQLSGGEMQRTSIARALVAQPEIVLADEPTGNISTKAGAEVMKLLRSSCDDLGQTILLVTHNAKDAAWADEVHFLKDGEIARDVSLRDGDVNEARVFDCLAQLDI